MIFGENNISGLVRFDTLQRFMTQCIQAIKYHL